MEYTTRLSKPDDTNKMLKFIHDHFLPVMPLILVFDLQDSPPNRSTAQPPPAPEDFTILAEDSQGDIIGLAMNKFKPVFLYEPCTPETAQAVKDMTELMHYVEREAHLERLPERTVELRILSVREDWRKRGLGRSLTEESMKQAKSVGFKAMTACCTSEFTARMMSSLGWREHYRMKYQDYPELSGRKVDLKEVPPHDHLYYYVTDL